MLFHRLSALVSSFISLLCQDLNWLVSESGFHLFSHLYLSQKGEQMLCDPRHSARHHCCTSIGLWWSMGIAWCFCIDYGNVSRWMEPDLSPGFMQFLLREEKTGEQQSDITHLPFLFFCLHDSASRSQLHLSHSYFCPSTWRRLSGTSWVSEKRRSSPFSSCLDQLSQVVSRCRTAHFSNKMPW